MRKVKTQWGVIAPKEKNAQLYCSKKMLKFTLIFTLKVLLHVLVLNNHHQGACHLCFAKVIIVG
jgi:hypothetical protein